LTSFILRRQMTIEPGQCDPAGIVFNSRFFECFDANTWMLFEAALGVRRQNIAKTFGTVGFPLVDVRANFLKPVKLGDVIEISSRVAEFRRSASTLNTALQLMGNWRSTVVKAESGQCVTRMTRTSLPPSLFQVR
jgi:Predicted thioesterase